jgi:hypothetical protein
LGHKAYKFDLDKPDVIPIAAPDPGIQAWNDCNDIEKNRKQMQEILDGRAPAPSDPSASSNQHEEAPAPSVIYLPIKKLTCAQIPGE